ncbi:MAG TPA: DUF6029 family protein [Ignavibacteria bacterium]
MRKIFTVLVLLFLYSTAFSQINLNVKASVNNLLRYGNGYEYTGSEKNSKEYFENLTDARLSVNDFTLGMRYEISDPIEYGRDFKGIRKRFVEYKNDIGIAVRAGDYWDIVSRGMTFNSFEDRTLAYDTGVDGVRVSYKKTFGDKNPVKIKAQILGGDIEYSDYLTPERIETYKVRDANFEISPVKNLLIGTNYVYSKGVVPSGNARTNITANLPEAYMNLNLGDFSFYSSYAHKNIIAERNTVYPVGFSSMGDGFYSSLSYSKAGLGVTIEYKNYRFDLTNPDNQSNERASKMLPFQNPPTAIKEHTWTLISRNPHTVDFNDEVGGQVDIVYVVNDNLNFNLNGSVASRHYDYINTDNTGKIVYQRIERNFALIPSLDKQFSPFWEVYLEGEYYMSKKTYAKLALYRQNSVIYNNIIPNASEQLFVTTVPLQLKYIINKEYSVKLVAEQQVVHNSVRNADQLNYYNQLIAVNLTKSPELGFTLSAEFTNDNEEPTGKKSWFQGEVLYKLNQSNTIMVSYGSERGGLRCTNGICRFVKPFEGFRFTFQSHL